MKLRHVSLMALSLSLAVGPSALAAGKSDRIQGEVKNVQTANLGTPGEKAPKKEAQKKKKVTKKKKAKKSKKATTSSAKKGGTAKNPG